MRLVNRSLQLLPLTVLLSQFALPACSSDGDDWYPPPSQCFGWTWEVGQHLPNQRESEFFALRWGDDEAITEAHASEVLELAEDARSCIVGTLGFPALGYRAGTDGRIPIYIGDTGVGSPTAKTNYVEYGEDGPYIVLMRSRVTGLEDAPSPDAPSPFTRSERLAGIIRHELFHTVQSNLGYHSDDCEHYYERQAWLSEGAASWAAWQCGGGQRGLYSLPLLAGLPHLSLERYDYPRGTLATRHQYGTATFLDYLTRELHPSFVLDLYSQAEADGIPLDDMRLLVARRGPTLGERFAQFAAELSVYDLPDSDVAEQLMSWAAARFPGEPRPVAAEHVGSTDGWDRVAPRLRPERFGYSTVSLQRTVSGAGTVVVWHAGPPGSAHATAVLPGRRYVRLVPDRADPQFLTADLPELEAGAVVKLVTVYTPEDDLAPDQLTYAYQFRE